MGRYYNMESGDFDGKFGFGVQASDAGRRFGMGEPNTIILYTDNEKAVLDEINEIFKAMGVPKKDRRVDFSKEENPQEAIYQWAKDINLWGYAVKDIPREEAEKTGRQSIYSSDKEGFVGVPKSRELLGDYYDLMLGIQIYNDVIRNGYCEMTCEC